MIGLMLDQMFNIVKERKEEIMVISTRNQIKGKIEAVRRSKRICHIKNSKNINTGLVDF